MGRTIDPDQIIKQHPLRYVDEENNNEEASRQLQELLVELNRQLQELAEVFSQMNQQLRSSMDRMDNFSQVLQSNQRAFDNIQQQHEREIMRLIAYQENMARISAQQKQPGYFSRFVSFCTTQACSLFELVVYSM